MAEVENPIQVFKTDTGSGDLSFAEITVAFEEIQDIKWLENAWCDLEARADTSFFLSWHWIGCWLGQIDCRPSLLIARRGELPVGLALVQSRSVRRHKLFPVTTLYLNQTGENNSDVITIEYNDILADRSCVREVRQACLEYLVCTNRIGGQRWDELALRGIDEELRPEIEATGLRSRLTAHAPSAYVDLEEVRASGKPYLQHVSSNTRRQIRRAMALYEERGPLHLKAAGTVEEALAFFDDAGALHQGLWNEKGKPGAFAHPFFISFHRALIGRCLPKGAVEMIRVSVGEEPIGYLYNFIYRGGIYYYFSGFRYENDNKLKPGMVSHYLCIQRHLDGGAKIYDFMAGQNRYKMSLGKAGPNMIALVLQQPRLLLFAENCLRGLKNILVKRLPKR